MTNTKRQKGIKYAKIPKKHKVLFLKKVVEDKSPLKSTAKLFKINYSTAKTLLRQYRLESPFLQKIGCLDSLSTSTLQKNENLQRCSYKQVLNFPEVQNDFPIISFSGVNEQKDNNKPIQKFGFILKNGLTQRENGPKISIVSKILFL